jgi:hypothetical protein
MTVVPPNGLIFVLQDFLRAGGRGRGKGVKDRVGSKPSLREAAFERGERPLPGASSPPECYGRNNAL